MTHDQNCPANQGGGCLGPPTCDAEQASVPVYDGTTDEMIGHISVEPAFAEILERNGYRLTLDSTPVGPRLSGEAP